MIREDFLFINQLHYELFKILFMTRESNLAIAKLNFWRDNIENLYQNKVSQDPLSLCLNETLKKSGLPLSLFLKMVDGRIAQAEKPNPLNMAQMIIRAQDTHVPLLLLTLRLMRIPITESPALIEVVESVAVAMGIIESIKMIPFDFRNEMERLPSEISRKHNLHFSNVWDKQTGAPNPDLFDAVLE